MGCNCGNKGKQNVVWEYRFHGKTTIYKSEVQARAAQIRNSGGTISTRAA